MVSERDEEMKNDNVDELMVEIKYLEVASARDEISANILEE